MHCLTKVCCRDPHLAKLILRLGMGSIFIYAGWGKFFGPKGVAGVQAMLDNFGIPFSGFFSYLVPAVELLGGIAMILGIFTSIAGVLLAAVMFVAFAVAKKFSYPAGFVDVALFSMALSFVFMGPGKYSLAHGLWCPKCRAKMMGEPK